ncbi:complex I NDUFA9 subunit family protein [Devosia albogilva]|uniref:Complex I NDUFA9 subunit family protein n=1 Tax=Devosia albogilva TaxID=429726 RepID=A0ABW5QKP1_9HYPH
MERYQSKLVTIFGGGGFVGTQVVQELARRGHRVRVAVRRPNLAIHTRMFGNVGQIHPIQANIRNAESVRRAVEGAHIVINLVGVGKDSGPQTFEAVHVEGAATVAREARAAGAASLVHMSALGVDAAAEVSRYARSKLDGEARVREAFPDAVIMRPSLIFGQDDGFFNMMAGFARILPVMPLIGGKTRFQPVYVGDVAQAIALAAEGSVKVGRIYELGGPEVVTHRELLSLILKESGRNRPLLPVPTAIARLMSMVPGGPITTDQVRLLHVDNVVSDAAIKDKRTLAGFGIPPVGMATILPTYLWRFRPHGEFDRPTTDAEGVRP